MPAELSRRAQPVSVAVPAQTPPPVPKNSPAVLLATVQTKDEDGGVGPRERVAVIKGCEAKPRTWYTLSNAHQARRGQVARQTPAW